MTTRAVLLERFDGNGDGVLSKRELSNRADLFAAADADRSTLLENEELERVETLVLAAGEISLVVCFLPSA